MKRGPDNSKLKGFRFFVADSPAQIVLMFNCEGEAWCFAIFGGRWLKSKPFKSETAMIDLTGWTQFSKANV